MKKTKSTWRYGWILGMLLLWLCGMQVFATGLSDDNSLADLGVENGTVSPEFYYSTVEYTVTVSPGTTSLVLNPVCSNANAQIVSIDGTTLDNGSGTVTITVRSESGNDAVYTLHVQSDPSAAQTETETETQATEAPATEKQTEAQTEAVQTEAQTEDSATITFLNGQISQFREKLDFSMKIIYGLIALAVVLMFLSINLLLKNRDLKDDLRDAEVRPCIIVSSACNVSLRRCLNRNNPASVIAECVGYAVDGSCCIIDHKVCGRIDIIPHIISASITIFSLDPAAL